VSLRVWNNDESLFVSVTDLGPGIGPEALTRIFDKFYRGSAAPTGGTGLGLSLVKGFIEALGGTVNAKNCEGGGAQFTIELPLTQSLKSPAVSI
jgi:two-component system sensor histidine kinase KdpD